MVAMLAPKDGEFLRKIRELAQSHQEPPGGSLGMRCTVAPQPFPHLLALRWLKYDIICALLYFFIQIDRGCDA
jgi:hypothetical protein